MVQCQEVIATILDLRNCLRMQYNRGRVVMGRTTVYLETVYGDVTATCESVTFPGDAYEFKRGEKSLQEYCDFIIAGIEKYSSPLLRVKEMLHKITSCRMDGCYVHDTLVRIYGKDFIRICSEYGDVCVASDCFFFDMLNGTDVSSLPLPYVGYFYRGDMDLYEYCSFVLHKIEEYTNGISLACSGVGDEIDNSWLSWKNIVCSYLGGEKTARDVLENEFRRFASAVRQYAVYWGEYFGAEIKDVNVSVLRNAFGEYRCKDGIISLNRNIIALNPMYVKEIVLHELCHYFEISHRYDFWVKLESMCCAAGLVRSCYYVNRIFPDKKGARTGIYMIPCTRDDAYRLDVTKRMLRGFKINI